VRPNEDAALGFTLRVAVKILVVEESKRSDNNFQLYHVRSVGIISGNHHAPLSSRCNLMGYEETEVVASVGASITLKRLRQGTEQLLLVLLRDTGS
jgi:hypothetical protein